MYKVISATKTERVPIKLHSFLERSLRHFTKEPSCSIDLNDPISFDPVSASDKIIYLLRGDKHCYTAYQENSLKNFIKKVTDPKLLKDPKTRSLLTNKIGNIIQISFNSKGNRVLRYAVISNSSAGKTQPSFKLETINSFIHRGGVTNLLQTPPSARPSVNPAQPSRNSQSNGTIYL